ncbi:MAG: SusF/SusE family outer membrane protein [Prevotella sp.]|nr:SusF/SusE family outer membrane protein [Prevotella sp.]
MKKIYKSLLLAMVACLPFLTSCKDDHGSNPTLWIPASFELNMPAFAVNNVYDLPAAETLNLTTSQPDYGDIPLAVTYAPQISLDGSAWEELATTFTSTDIQLSTALLNSKILELYRAAHEDADPEGVLPLNIRLRAYLADSDIKNFGQVYSNAITVNVLSYDIPSDVTLPEQIVVCGNSIADAWKTWKPCAPVYGREGKFYTMIYNNADGFKWGFKENDWFGYDLINEIDNQVDGLEITAASDGNIVFSKAGWYVLEFICKIVGPEVQTKLVVAPGAAGVTGAAVDNGSWSGVAMTAPASKDGNWTFSDFTGTGELRAYITVPGEDWWRTEFTLYQGELYWRTVDIPQNWAENVGPEYSVEVSSGKTLKINFDTNTGSVE